MSGDAVRRARRTARYQRWRAALLAAEPLCRLCRAAGYTVAAEELDHIVPASRAPERFWDESNVQPVCRACHEAKSAREAGRDETPEEKAWRERLEAFG